MVLEHLLAPEVKKGVILDGFPRNLEQAEALDEALARQGKSVDKVIYIKVSQEELLKRLGGRWICRRCQTPYHVTDFPPGSGVSVISVAVSFTSALMTTRRLLKSGLRSTLTRQYR